jgi:hypothetical protein
MRKVFPLSLLVSTSMLYFSCGGSMESSTESKLKEVNFSPENFFGEVKPAWNMNEMLHGHAFFSKICSEDPRTTGRLARYEAYLPFPQEELNEIEVMEVETFDLTSWGEEGTAGMIMIKGNFLFERTCFNYVKGTLHAEAYEKNEEGIYVLQLENLDINNQFGWEIVSIYTLEEYEQEFSDDS